MLTSCINEADIDKTAIYAGFSNEAGLTDDDKKN